MLDKSQQFEKLMMHYLSENISDADERILLDILNSDPKYKVRYNEMVKTRAISLIPFIESQKTSNYKNLLQLLNNGLSLNSQPKFLQYFVRIAAIIIFVLSTSIFTYYIYTGYNNSTNNLMSYQTVVPLGSEAKIVLPDGTVAWLNSGSTLKYNNQYGKENREVSMSGEGYFEVQKNLKKPFLVYVDKIKVRVLGTVFNVRAYSDDKLVEVNLLKGKVDVSLCEGINSEVVTLEPNEKMIYNKESHKMDSYKADAARSASWTNGKLCFVDASLEDISNDLERRFDVQIYIKSQKIKEELFSGSLDLNQSISEILEYLDVDKKYSKTFNGKMISITNSK